MPEAAGRDFLVPDLGEGLEEATVVTWLVAPGDRVVLNQPLVVLETAKAEVEIPSPFAGTVVELGGREGETLRVGALLAHIEAAPAAAHAGADEAQPTLVGYGHDGSSGRSRRRRMASAVGSASVATAAPAAHLGRPMAKPPVRKLARELGVDLSAIHPGGGPGGIVTRADVHAAASDATRPKPRTIADDPSTHDLIPLRGMRARIAERMTESRREIPDATCSVTVDCSRLLAVRTQLNAEAERAGNRPVVTPFSLACRMVVAALVRVPVLNATFERDVPQIRLSNTVQLGIGTSTERGLVVPVIRSAETRSTLDLSAEIARLGEGARAGTLSPADLTGSTFTISNFGALGLDEGVPIINHPEVAILGVGSIKERPFVVDGQVVARPTVSVTLVFDHRVCDGAEAGQFLADLRAMIETPELLLLRT